MRPPIPANEAQRLDALTQCGILHTPPEPAFDDLTRLAAEACQAPIALIPLVAETHQWFKSRVGIELLGTPRDVAFCAHAIASDEPLIVEDATTDPRFQHNPLVVGPPHIRAYAGVPLTTREGFRLGTLCVIDTTARTFTPHQIDVLRVLAAQASSQLDLRHTMRRMEAAELELHRALHAAHAANAAKSEFLSLMTQELRTPLQEILGAIGLLGRTALDDRQRRCAQLADTSSVALLELVDDVLDLCRIEAGELRLESLPFDPRRLANEVLEQVQTEAGHAGIRFSVSLDPAIPAALRGDPIRLRQILVNLARGAVRIARPGNLQLRAAVVSKDATTCAVCFEIRDTASCINRERRSHLAHAFRQSGAPTSRRFARTGFGIAVAARLAELMRAPVECADDADAETVCAFTPTLAIHAASPHLRDSPAPTPVRRALVAVRDPIAREIVEELLASTGIHTVRAPSLREAPDLVASVNPGLLVLGVPGNPDDALACAQRVRREAGALPILLLATPNALTPAGVPACVTETAALPVHPDELLEKAHRLLPAALPGRPTDLPAGSAA